MAATTTMERELLALASKYEAQDDPVDVLEALSRQAKLLAATEKLRRLMRLDAARAGGSDGLFELRPRKADGAMELVGEGGRMARRLRVREHEDVRLLDGTTTIRARVDLLPLPRDDEGKGKGSAAAGVSSKKKRPRPQAAAVAPTEAVQLHFHFTRRPGPKRGSSMPHPAAAPPEEALEMMMMGSETGPEEEGDEEASSSPSSHSSRSKSSISSCGGGSGGGCCPDAGCCEEKDDGAAPTTIIEYSISATPSAAEPPVQILHVVVYGLHPSGAPSPRGIRGPEDEEEDEEEEGTTDPKDLGLVELDDEALAAALEWSCGPEAAWEEPEMLNFLLFFPYIEEEFNVPGLVMEQIFGPEEDEDEEEGSEEESESESEAEPLVRLPAMPPSQKQTKGKGDKGEKREKKRKEQRGQQQQAVPAAKKHKARQ